MKVLVIADYNCNPVYQGGTPEGEKLCGLLMVYLKRYNYFDLKEPTEMALAAFSHGNIRFAPYKVFSPPFFMFFSVSFLRT